MAAANKRVSIEVGAAAVYIFNESTGPTARLRIVSRSIWGTHQVSSSSYVQIKKGSVSNNSSAAYLLRLLALHQRHHRYLIEVSHIPSVLNTMADDASRLWHLSDSAFLSYFDHTYPQQQS
jgi:hypothetical protein